MAPAKPKKTLKQPGHRVPSVIMHSEAIQKEPKLTSKAKSAKGLAPPATQTKSTVKRDIFEYPGTASTVEENEDSDQEQVAPSIGKKRTVSTRASTRTAKRQKPTPAADSKSKTRTTDLNKKQTRAPAEHQAAEGLMALSNHQHTGESVTSNESLAVGPPATRTRSATIQNVNDGIASSGQDDGLVPSSPSASDETNIREEGAKTGVLGIRSTMSMHKSSARAPTANMGTIETRQSATGIPAGTATQSTAIQASETSASSSTSDELQQPEQSDKAREDVLNVIPDRKKQPLLSKEYKSLKLPPVEENAFFGFGRSWNDLTQQREQLLICRPELAETVPGWYTACMEEGRNYPMTLKGREALNAMNLKNGLQKSREDLIHDCLMSFKKDEQRDVEATQADICHFVIPRLIRYIHSRTSKESDYKGSGDVKKLAQLQIIDSIANLFKRLQSLSEIPSNMMKEGVSLGLNASVDEALEVIQTRSQELHTAFHQYVETERAKREEHVKETKRIRHEREREVKREQFERHREANQQRLRREAEAARREEMDKRIAAQRLAILERDRAIALQAEEETVRRWRTQELRRAALSRKAWDERFEMKLALRTESAVEYYAEISRTISERTNSSARQTLGMSGVKKSGSTQSTGLGRVSWTDKLSALLVTRLSKFDNLSDEARYTKCLDCVEFRNMSTEILRYRALEMKPTLEDQYKRKQGGVPGWVSSIR